MVHNYQRWSYDNQGELDALEDIFKAPDWNEPALKPALSCILAPALCAVYGAKKDGMNVSTNEAVKELSCIQVNIESVEEVAPGFFFDDDDEDELLYKDGLSFSSPASSPSANTRRPRSPELLYPPIPTLTAVKERLPIYFNYKYSSIFVSGYEAERQRTEKKTFGKDTASMLAERRSSYTKRRRERDREECIIVENEIDNAIDSKFYQLQMADELEKTGSERNIRRAKLWRRCAAMAEVLAKEHAEALLWKQRYEEAAGISYGNKLFH